MIRKVGAYALALLVAYVLAAVAATQWALASLTGMGMPISFAQRLGVTAHDLIGMLGSFLPLVAGGFLIAFLVGGLLARKMPEHRSALYVAAGAAALWAVHALLNLAFGITPVAAARSLPGLLVQSLAGAIGGYVFARVSRRRA